jgi:DnaJ-class molecular chaperone
MSVITCAFCKGRGMDPFNLLSELATCLVCGSKGKVEIAEPAIPCVYCKGSGISPLGARITCIVCRGKGRVTVPGDTVKCSKCKGTGRVKDGGLPCTQCGGKGVIGLKIED